MLTRRHLLLRALAAGTLAGMARWLPMPRSVPEPMPDRYPMKVESLEPGVIGGKTRIMWLTKVDEWDGGATYSNDGPGMMLMVSVNRPAPEIGHFSVSVL